MAHMAGEGFADLGVMEQWGENWQGPRFVVAAQKPRPILGKVFRK